jgi:hypothetical protein
VSYDDDMSRWSNRKKADLFLQLLTHTVARLGGEVRVPLDELVSFAPDIGFAVEDGKMVIAVDMDNAPTHVRTGCPSCSGTSFQWSRVYPQQPEVEQRQCHDCGRFYEVPVSLERSSTEPRARSSGAPR